MSNIHVGMSDHGTHKWHLYYEDQRTYSRYECDLSDQFDGQVELQLISRTASVKQNLKPPVHVQVKKRGTCLKLLTMGFKKQKWLLDIIKSWNNLTNPSSKAQYFRFFRRHSAVWWHKNLYQQSMSHSRTTFNWYLIDVILTQVMKSSASLQTQSPP